MAIYLCAVNPWFAPDQHDDILYYFGAESIRQTGVFGFNGTPITDWPPMFSFGLSCVFGLFGSSVIVAKIAVIGTAIGGMWAIHKFSKMRGESDPALLVFVVGLLPISLRSGAGILSEWPYMFASFGFLCALEALRQERRWQWAVLAGVLLAVASLTRFLGVFLGVAIIAQAIALVWEHRSLRRVLPEMATAAFGAVPWLIWKSRSLSVIQSGEAPVGVYSRPDHYWERFSDFNPIAFSGIVEDTIFSLGKVARGVLGLTSLGWIIAAACLLLVVAGVVLRAKRGNLSPADYYALACLFLFSIDVEKNERYFFPLTPFLVLYVITAVQSFARHLEGRARGVVPAAVVGCWATWVLGLCGVQLVHGNLTGNRGGYSMLVSPTIDDYYRGDALEMLRAIRNANGVARNGEPIGTVGFHGKYVYVFTGRDFVLLDGEEPRPTRVFIVRGERMPSPEHFIGHPEQVGKFGDYRVFAGS